MSNFHGKPIVPISEIRGINHSIDICIHPSSAANALASGVYQIAQIPTDLGEFVFRGACVRVTMTGILGTLPQYSIGWGATPNQFVPSANHLSGWGLSDSGKMKYHLPATGSPISVMPAGGVLNLSVTSPALLFSTFTLEGYIIGYYIL